MQALAVFPTQHATRLIDEREPGKPTGTQVLIRIREVGVCGTDREIAHFEYGTVPQGTDHLVLGHEALAKVVAVGPDVTSLSVGDWVVPTVRRPCSDPRCRACRVGRSDFCLSGAFRERGIREAQGFMTELVLDDEQYLVHVPAEIADVAVLVEPLSVSAKARNAVEAFRRRLPWETTTERALVLGAGPIGLLAAMAMSALGERTTVYSREHADGERARLVRSFGGTYVSAQTEDLASLSKRVGTFDLLFDAVGVPSVIFNGLRALGPNGICILTGVPALREPEAIEASGLLRQLVLQNQVVFGTVNASRRSYEEAIYALEQLMTRFPDAVRKLITARVPLASAADALHSRTGIKQVIQVESPSA